MIEIENIYQELIELNNQTIEMILNTLLINKDKLSLSDVAGMYSLINDCCVENEEYNRLAKEEYEDLTNF